MLGHSCKHWFHCTSSSAFFLPLQHLLHLLPFLSLLPLLFLLPLLLLLPLPSAAPMTSGLPAILGLASLYPLMLQFSQNRPKLLELSLLSELPKLSILSSAILVIPGSNSPQHHGRKDMAAEDSPDSKTTLPLPLSAVGQETRQGSPLASRPSMCAYSPQS